MELIKGLKRTKYCGEFCNDDIGKEIVVFGWAQRVRDLGKLIFIDLRDRTGILQLAFDENTDKDIFQKAFTTRSEYIISAKGIVRERSSKNAEIPTGDIEIEVKEYCVISKSETPPFEIVDDSTVNEELRLKYRYLDLRRPDLNKRIIDRHRIVKTIRDYFDENDFIEIETPILIKSTPEGARDYLVPSRVFKGEFFALPQSPQLYKQLTMLAGFDRYMQIAKCFRDEDLRADRQPEFTQIDLEMSFIEIDDIIEISENMIKRLYKEILNIDIDLPLKRMTYEEAMNRFGSDKPDTRFGMELVDLTDILTNTNFKVFSSAINNGGSVQAINAKGLANKYTRKTIDELIDWVKWYGAKGIAWTKNNMDGTKNSSFEKFLDEKEINEIYKKANIENGDLLLIISSEKIKIVQESLGALRLKIAEENNIINKNKIDALWVIDFPLLEYDEDEKRYVAKHHPFTMPLEEDLHKLETKPSEVRAKAYDMILNGNEIGGGSIRINNSKLQQKMFKVLGFTTEQIKEQFGFLIDAYKYGAVPHGGMAFGLDRIIMIMLSGSSIRDVIAFPKTASSGELMTSSPSKVDNKQLDELGLKLK